MNPHADLVILGGGCAGLSLAMRLAELGPACPKTIILEARDSYTNDRSWCFWQDDDQRWARLILHRWPKMKISADGRSTTVNCGARPYAFLEAKAFYRHALDVIAQNPNIKLKIASPVLSQPRKSGSGWTIDTAKYNLTAKRVIDTRPDRAPVHGTAILWQSFMGHEIECDTAVFDPKRCDLMDFANGNKTDIRFTYVLPLSPTRALVETTIFGQIPVVANLISGELSAAVARLTGGHTFTILRSEHGILPMGTVQSAADTDPTFVKAGLMAGAARPSTGYAFQRIQRWADACVQRLVKDNVLVGHAPGSIVLRSMDQLFLSVLRARPETGPAMFFSLFDKVDPARIIRFLSDCGTLLDYAVVARALPVLPFLQEIPAAYMRTAKLREALR